MITSQSTLSELIKKAFRELQKDISTSIPGQIITFDPATQRAQIQIGVRRIPIGNGEQITAPPLIEVPVYFLGGSTHFVENEITEGAEGIVIFSQRCVDAWKSQGGIAQNPIARLHDLSDGMFLPGFRSEAGVIQNHANDGVRFRNADASHYIWLKRDGTITETNGTYTRTAQPDGTITETNGTYTRTVNADGSISETNGVYNMSVGVDGTVTINGFVITPQGAATSPISVGAPTIAAGSSMTVESVEVKEHTHGAGEYVDAESRPITGNSGALE